ncbi:MAG: hypothetical protein KKA36_09440 [Gammaproteobacteria bacterium]|nr:hypothetical protein [Gammaproteobacteria bacterium]MBU2479299.1 hypothetical protein [Gammaproteobacteria bacterium]
MIRHYAVLVALFLISVTVNASGLSDPTRPSGSISASAESGAVGVWRLNATRITPTQRSAVINGIKVAEGGDIGGARVLRISHAQVQLQSQGEILNLQLQPTQVKKSR